MYGRRYAHYLGVIVNVYNTKLHPEANGSSDPVPNDGPYIVEFSAVIEELAGHEDIVALPRPSDLTFDCVRFDCPHFFDCHRSQKVRQ